MTFRRSGAALPVFMLDIDQELGAGAPLYLAMIGLDEDGSVPALFDARFEVQAIAVAR